MNREDAIKLCRLAKAASPAQAVDEYTPDLWFAVLGKYRFADAYEALIELAGDQEWVHVSHVRARIKRIRRDRVDAFGVLPDPPSECFEPADYRKWYADTVRAIADGEAVERPALPEPGEKPDIDFANVLPSVDA